MSVADLPVGRHSDPRATILTWLGQLYDNVPDDRWVTVNFGGSFFATDWRQVEDYESIVDAVLHHNERHCVWLGVATRREQLAQGRGGAQDCVELPGLWLDIDIEDPRYHAAPDLPATSDDAMRIVGRFPLPPTAVVHSGHGLQVWWLFDEPLAVAEVGDLLDRWEATWLGYAGALGYGLDNVFDVARVLRVPGTVNRKGGDAAPVELISADWDRRYGLDHLDPHLVEPPPKPEPRERSGGFVGTRPGDLWAAKHTWAELLTADGATYLGEGKSRHGIYQKWARPGVTDHPGGTVDYGGSDVLKVFSSAWSVTNPTTGEVVTLDAEGVYTKFGYWAATRYGGDHTAAARALKAAAPPMPAAASANGTNGESGANGVAFGRRVILEPAAAIEPRRVKWCWEGRLAVGTLGLLAGPEGLGKSTCAFTIGAMLSQGTLRGEHTGTPKSVLVCATEDSWAHTIVPRLMAAGADLSRVYRVGVKVDDELETGLSLPDDLVGLEEAAMESDAALLILDPLMSRLNVGLDTHRDGEVRRALEPLVAIAERTGMAILGLIHHNKSGSTDPLQLVMASKAFTAVARSVHTVIKDPDDETGLRRYFGTHKNNLGRTDLPTLGFTIEGWTYGTVDGDGVTGRLVWGVEVTESISDILTRSARDPEEKSALEEAVEWLEDYLSDRGGSSVAGEIQRSAKAAGHAERTLRRARKVLEIDKRKDGYQGVWVWALPNRPKVATNPQDRQLGPLAPLASPGPKEANNNKGAKGVSPHAREAPLEEGEGDATWSAQACTFARGSTQCVNDPCPNPNHRPDPRSTR